MKLVRLAVGVAAAGLLLAGCSASMDGSPTTASTTATPAATFTMYGELQLTDDNLASVDNCHASGGYKDIGTGAAVTVTDANGTTIAVGKLKSGLPVANSGGDTCVYTFTVEDVPLDAKFYAVEVSHRGAVTFTKDQAKAAVKLELGN